MKAFSSLVSCALVLATLGAGAAHASTPDHTIVGTVTFALGDAVAIGVDGVSQPLRKGSTLRQTDAIQTGANGQVHVRMIDQALVSVRPNSDLVISDYRYDAVEPSKSVIKFVLREGTIRSITGKGGAAAKDQYRLNTPLAAIGIRGTDFTVQATPVSTRVGVQSGAIALSPFSDACRADGMGACASDSATVLTAAMRDLQLEIQRGAVHPNYVPSNKSLDALDNEPTARKGDGVTLGSESVSESKSADRAETVLTRVASVPVVVVTPPKPDPVIETPVVVVPDVPKVIPAHTPAIAWGRYSEVVNAEFKPAEYGSFDAIYAALGKDASSMGSLAGFALIRSSTDTELPSSGKVGFTLAASEAYLAKGSQFVERANISKESLNVDFGARTFNTSMQVTAPTANISAQVSASGIVTDNGPTSVGGMLQATSASPDTNLIGTLGAKGTQAGILFQRGVGDGQSLLGATRWVR